MIDKETFAVDDMTINIYNSRGDLGIEAAKDVAMQIATLFESGRDSINIVFAAAPSQNEFLEALVLEKINWTKINAFHMDEYIGLEAGAPQGFGNFLRSKIFGRVSLKSVNYLNGNSSDPDEELQRYARLLKNNPPDIICMGIGENTHIAFNDPHVADFKDPLPVKVVQLDIASRIQQVNDGCFQSLDEVPVRALTLTIPVLMDAKYIYCMVPSELKATAVHHTLHQPISEAFPSTILRRHKHTTLYLDRASAKLL